MIKRNSVAIIFLAVVAVFLIFGALKVHQFGSPEYTIEIENPFTGEPEEVEITPWMDDHIIDNAQNETGANNAVTSVVFDYRGFDTLGEATVLFTAVAGVIMIFRRLKK